MPSLLIVDDLTAIHEMLAAVIQPTGYTMAFAGDGESALRQYKSNAFDVVLADIAMKPMDGIELLQRLKQYDPSCVVILMTGYASIDSAIQALKNGAFDYIQKPFRIDELIQTLKRAVETRLRNREQQGEGDEIKGDMDIGSILVGECEATKRLIVQVRKLIHANTPVLLLGETGTGRRQVAEIIHLGQNGPDKPFHVVDCAHAGESLLRQSLLGESGGASEWLNRARGGSICLQNIELLPLPLQKAFVQVIKRCGNEIRLIFTSGEDLESRVDEGAFYDELFFRIATLPLYLPPLRHRLEDLPHLVGHFLLMARNPRFESGQIEFSPDAMARMRRYAWPGNVLELQQVVTSLASSTSERVIEADQLPLKLTGLEDWPNLAEYLAQREKHYIRTVYQAAGKDRDLTLRILGCDPSKLEDLDLPVEDAARSSS